MSQPCNGSCANALWSRLAACRTFRKDTSDGKTDSCNRRTIIAALQNMPKANFGAVCPETSCSEHFYSPRSFRINMHNQWLAYGTVSYTHLDVYKRQMMNTVTAVLVACLLRPSAATRRPFALLIARRCCGSIGSLNATTVVTICLQNRIAVASGTISSQRSEPS